MSTLRLTGRALAYRDGVQQMLLPGDIALVPGSFRLGQQLGWRRVQIHRDTGKHQGYVATHGQGCVRIANWRDVLPPSVAQYNSRGLWPLIMQRMVWALKDIESFEVQEVDGEWRISDPERARVALYRGCKSHEAALEAERRWADLSLLGFA